MTKTATTTRINDPLMDEARWLLSNSLAPPVRSIGTFAEEEIVIPRGRFAGQRYKIGRKPSSRLWFDALDSRQWRRHVVTGPTQSGKSLECFVIPILYFVFERREDVIVGVPHINMASRKWTRDLLPAIQRTRFRDLLPTKGAGSRGGEVTDVEFRNGVSLTFMSGGGDDKSRAGETAPNLVVTETDGLDTASSSSREADPLKQLEARTLSYDDRACVIMECTVSTEQGRTWQEYQAGTRSQIVRPCPHCQQWVTPEREHFQGWQEAETEVAASRGACFHCPACDHAWTDEERFDANQKNKLLHRGQTIDQAGEIAGDSPATFTFGFRWSAVDNPFRSSAMLGAIEWNAARAENQDNAEKEVAQFQWARPYVAPELDDTPLDADVLAVRAGRDPSGRGVIPFDHEVVTMGVDIGKHRIHYVAAAWCEDATARVIDYGELAVRWRQHGVLEAIGNALVYLRDHVIATGWSRLGEPPVDPDQVWIDARYKSSAIYSFVRQCNTDQRWHNLFRPIMGRGSSKKYEGRYTQPTKRTKDVVLIRDAFYFQRVRPEGVTRVIVNADNWKSFVHDRLSIPETEGGAMTLFLPASGDHTTFCRHLTAEKETVEFIPGKGAVRTWVAIRKNNHYLDALCYSAAAAAWCDVSPIREVTAAPPGPSQDASATAMPVFETPDGRNFFS